MHPELKRIILFLFSGGIVFVTAFCLNWVLVHWFYFSPLVAYAISALPVFLLSFSLQSKVVFKSNNVNLKTYTLFLGSVIVSNIFGAFVLLFFLRLTIYEISIFISLGSQSIISYFVLRKIVFK
jgi:putative flippase GtrA